ncbi:MAG: hypothetical protein D6773_08405 [Alphaproteobacteria bacterium]|nr:MAG: hypothetical protein D6773_08405 [Alphaproteobacteria bacterium]
MDLNRRKFFGVAAASPLAAREMAKKAIEEAQMQASGISVYSDSLYTGIPISDTPPSMRSLWEALRDMGIPEWKREDLREDARRSRTLDPDIAQMKSLSLGAKMRMQWERNYDRLVERAMRQSELARMRSAFFRDNPDVEEY